MLHEELLSVGAIERGRRAVRHLEIDVPERLQELSGAREEGHWVGNMLEHLVERDEIEASEISGALEVSTDGRDAVDPPFEMLHCAGVGIESGHGPPDYVHRGRENADARADVEERPGRAERFRDARDSPG